MLERLRLKIICKNAPKINNFQIFFGRKLTSKCYDINNKSIIVYTNYIQII